MDMPHATHRVAAVALAAIWATACVDDAPLPTDPGLEPDAVMSIGGSAPPPPIGLATVGSLELSPWTGRDLSGTIADPVNLLFKGDVDVVSLRAALLSLDGDRTAFGFPAVPPFNCTWTDVQGEMQPTYTNGAGWGGRPRRNARRLRDREEGAAAREGISQVRVSADED